MKLEEIPVRSNGILTKMMKMNIFLLFMHVEIYIIRYYLFDFEHFGVPYPV